MLTADLIRLYPELHHMAADASWPSIEKHGLLSTAALVDRWEINDPDARAALLQQRRDESRVIQHYAYGPATVRDQKPIHVESLATALVDMTVPEWLGVLNQRVFFFLQRERLSGLLNAGGYKKQAHTVITLDTASFVAAHEEEIELCAINSGFAQRHNKTPRGRGTFLPIADYKHPARDVVREKSPWDVAELCVKGGVGDIADHVIRVERMRGDDVLRRIA